MICNCVSDDCRENGCAILRRASELEKRMRHSPPLGTGDNFPEWTEEKKQEFRDVIERYKNQVPDSEGGK